MNSLKERILLIENNPETIDVVARQTLLPMGFKVQVATNGEAAIKETGRFVPDVIILDLKLPGLSGKDVLVAFASQGIEAPVIVLSERNAETDIIQAFRLGASDLLTAPLREAEVIAAVERVLKQVRTRREREMLTRQLNQTNQELQRRVRELTTIFAIGKAVVSVTDTRALLNKIIEGAVYVSEADFGWLLLRDEHSKNFLLSAHRNLPQSMAVQINQPWEDGLTSLVAISGESLSIYGEPLKRFKAAALGQAALVVPIKIKNDVVGLMTVVRKALNPMGASSQVLLEAVADYASIAIVNARLFKVLEDRAHSSQYVADSAMVSERIVDEIMQKASVEIHTAVQTARSQVDGMLSMTLGKLNVEQINSLTNVRDRLKSIWDIADSMMVFASDMSGTPKGGVELNEVVRQSVARFLPVAHYSGLTISSDLSAQSIKLEANELQLAKVVDSLVSNAIRFSPQGGQITVRVEKTADQMCRVSVQDRGPGIDEALQKTILKTKRNPASSGNRRFGGLAIGLPLAREIVEAHHGKMTVESRPGYGATFSFSLPVSNQ